MLLDTPCGADDAMDVVDPRTMDDVMAVVEPRTSVTEKPEAMSPTSKKQILRCKSKQKQEEENERIRMAKLERKKKLLEANRLLTSTTIPEVGDNVTSTTIPEVGDNVTSTTIPEVGDNVPAVEAPAAEIPLVTTSPMLSEATLPHFFMRILTSILILVSITNPIPYYP